MTLVNGVMVLALVLVSGCTRKNPDYCNTDEDCSDKKAPYCDSAGTIAAPHSCIACPVTGCAVDASVDPLVDAPVDAMADAAPGPAQGLGKVCEVESCPATGATNCLQVLGAGTKFCTPTCGGTPDTTPPAGGDMACMQSSPPPPSGTPACEIYAPDGTGGYIWYCVIKCGNDGPTVYGGCPMGLQCSINHVCN